MIILKLGIYPDIPYVHRVFVGVIVSNQLCATVLTCDLHSEPEWESFAKDRQRWEKPFEGTVQYKGKSKGEKMPDSI